jgi:hypothetical protein
MYKRKASSSSKANVFKPYNALTSTIFGNFKILLKDYQGALE